MEPVIHLINVSPNLVATEAAIGIVQNLTSDNYKSSIYLRAHIRWVFLSLLKNIFELLKIWNFKWFKWYSSFGAVCGVHW